MRFRFTLSRPSPSINSLLSWVDLGTGVNTWSINGSFNQEVTLGSFQGSSLLADNIINPYLGKYNFLISADGSVNGGAGNTADLTFHFLDEDENIIHSSDAITIPNAGIVDYPFSFETDGIKPFYVAVEAGNLTSSSNTVTISVIAYNPPEHSVVISEPDGWKGAKINWERDPSFFSLIEYYYGAANGAFIFYGKNEAEDIDGGIEFLKAAELALGFDADVTILIEYSGDDINYSTVFSGKLDLSQKVEMKDNKMQVPVVRDDFWTKFITRFDTPADLSKTEDIDGNVVDAVESITLQLPSQLIKQTYHAAIDSLGVSYAQFTNNFYYQIDFNDIVILDEIKERFTLPRLDNPELPASNFTLEFGGFYTFEIRIIASTFTTFNAESLKDPTDFIDYYIQFGTQSPIPFSWTDETVGSGVWTVFTFSGTYELTPNTDIRIYGQANTTSTKDLVILGGSSAGFSGSSEYASYCKITANTTHPQTEAQGYLIHDAIHGVLARIGLGTNPFYSEFLGGMLTKARQYDEDGCGWMYAVVKGLQLRQYTLTEKPFFISMKQLWDGINPILNLGLGYETIGDDQVIRIEPKSHFIGDTPAVNFGNVREISASYDADFIFKTVKTGYQKWQSEQASGIDDPQTKHTYALAPKNVGRELNLESYFIAASLAIETTRRTTREKSADYKFDNDTFIISLNTDDVSPDVYAPELAEKFTSITNLLNPTTRYNVNLTPMRNFIRWGNYWAGCLQSYLTSKVKFVSGEGNYDMASEAMYETCSQVIIDESLSEGQDFPMAEYHAVFGYLFLPMLYEIRIPMDKEDFDLLDRKQPIGISQTDSNHALFHIKEMEYEILKSEAVIKAWPKEFFEIAVPEQEINSQSCE